MSNAPFTPGFFKPTPENDSLRTFLGVRVIQEGSGISSLLNRSFAFLHPVRALPREPKSLRGYAQIIRSGSSGGSRQKHSRRSFLSFSNYFFHLPVFGIF